MIETLKKIKNELWDYNDFKRGLIMALISATVYYILTGPTTLLHDYYHRPQTLFGYWDDGFHGSYVQPYGILWYVLNPFFQNWQIYPTTSLLIYTAIIAPQVWLVKKGKINKWVIVLNVLTAIMFRANQTSQDATVIAFAPLVTINPWFSVLLLLQKMAIGHSLSLSDPYWITWISQVRGNPWQIPYIYLIAWFICPILIWLKPRMTKRKAIILLAVFAALVIILVLRQHQTCVIINEGWVCQ